MYQLLLLNYPINILISIHSHRCNSSTPLHIRNVGYHHARDFRVQDRRSGFHPNRVGTPILIGLIVNNARDESISTSVMMSDSHILLEAGSCGVDVARLGSNYGYADTTSDLAPT
jgi:hypothetical protein